jgi:lipopolysaccharide/colanic/teichoic acid biosynthesis glycosyltransferase
VSTTSFTGAEPFAAGNAVEIDGLLEEPLENPRVYLFGKRLIDLALGSFAFTLALPILVVAAVAVRVSSRGPILFRQRRVGLAGKTFTMWKLRTMYAGTDSDDAAHRAYVRSMFTQNATADARKGLHKLDDDRVTRVGRLLRRTSIDELPQLFNVLRGEMSLVGPRPALPWEVELFAPYDRLRSLVKPGITGLWQVSGRSRLTMRDALELDCAYARQRSLLLDIKILLKTIPVLIQQDAA